MNRLRKLLDLLGSVITFLKAVVEFVSDDGEAES